MVIIETSIFTRRITEMMSDEDYSEMQASIIARPDTGALMRGSGGIRKLRWAASGRGKRGGLRVIYSLLGLMPRRLRRTEKHKVLQARSATLGTRCLRLDRKSYTVSLKYPVRSRRGLFIF